MLLEHEVLHGPPAVALESTSAGSPGGGVARSGSAGAAGATPAARAEALPLAEEQILFSEHTVPSSERLDLVDQQRHQGAQRRVRDRSFAIVIHVPGEVVGAGVSTCAPGG